MEMPGISPASIYRFWVQIRKNPCTLELVRPRISVGEEYLRIRNDSDAPIQIFEMDFQWRPKGQRKFSEAHVPTVWSITDRLEPALAPGHSIEHPIDAEELGIEVSHVKVRIAHNRSNQLTIKTFKLHGPVG